MMNSVLSGFNLSIFDEQREDMIQFMKDKGYIFVRCMNKKLGVVGIKVEFDVGVPSI